MAADARTPPRTRRVPAPTSPLRCSTGLRTAVASEPPAVRRRTTSASAVRCSCWAGHQRRPTPAIDGPTTDGPTTDPTVPRPAAAAVSDVAHRCAASAPPAPVSLAQQRLICLDRDHVSCPRFVRAVGSPRAPRPARAAVPERAAVAGAAVAAATGPGAESAAGTAAAAAGSVAAAGTAGAAAGSTVAAPGPGAEGAAGADAAALTGTPDGTLGAAATTGTPAGLAGTAATAAAASGRRLGRLGRRAGFGRGAVDRNPDVTGGPAADGGVRRPDARHAVDPEPSPERRTAGRCPAVAAAGGGRPARHCRHPGGRVHGGARRAEPARARPERCRCWRPDCPPRRPRAR